MHDPVAIVTAGHIFAYLMQNLIWAQIFHVGCELPGLLGWLAGGTACDWLAGWLATTLSSVWQGSVNAVCSLNIQYMYMCIPGPVLLLE